MAGLSPSPLERHHLRQSFLRAQGAPSDLQETFLAGDCSFRTYFRLYTQKPWFAPQVVLMDAPPPEEDIRPFLKIAALLTKHGVRAPKVYAFEPEDGLMLLEDFGDITYRRALLEGASQKSLYQKAIEVLLQLETIPLQEDVPSFGIKALLKEMGSFWNWGMETPLEPALQAEALEVWRKTLAPLETHHSKRPVLVLRDYHVDNLMVLKGNGKESCGVLDFQDAGFGFQAYDVMSLLQDVRIEISDSFEAEMKSYYLNRQPKGFDRDGFEKSYTLLGLQRASKILGIFLRRIKRDQKIEMQTYLPRVWHEIEKGLASPLAKDLKLWWDEMFPKGRGK